PFRGSAVLLRASRKSSDFFRARRGTAVGLSRCGAFEMSKPAATALRVLLFAAACLALIGAPSGAPDNDAKVPAADKRPALLLPLYVSFASLQVLDIHSTQRAAEFGGREANPVVGRMLASPGVFVAAKIGAAAGTMLVTERLWKRNRTAAVLTMI